MGAQRSKGSKPENSAGPLSGGLEKSLSAYAYAATAAGVGLLALTQPAEARIVYTRTHTPIPFNGGPVPLNLNHDGVVDFSFSNWSVSCTACDNGPTLAAQVAPANQSNAIWGRGFFSDSFVGFAGGFAAALRRGFNVGPNNPYFHKGRNGLLVWAAGSVFFYSTRTAGQWLQTKSRYLGLQFLIDGQIHYGWARLQVSSAKRGFDVTLTGYAYETIPNKPIVTGETKGADVVVEAPQPISQTTPPATLGMLALGSSRYRFVKEMKRVVAPNASRH